MDRARAYFRASLGQDIFGETKKASQLVKQGEIDVLGLKINHQGAVEKLYSVDVAFHENGLGHVDPIETTKRVIKKLILSVMVVQTYFCLVPSELVFASPIVGKSFLKPLRDGVKTIEQLLEKEERLFAVSGG